MIAIVRAWDSTGRISIVHGIQFHREELNYF